MKLLSAYLARLFVPVYMQLQNGDVSEYLEKDGSLIVKIKKALYGLVESAENTGTPPPSRY